MYCAMRAACVNYVVDDMNMNAVWQAVQTFRFLFESGFSSSDSDWASFLLDSGVSSSLCEYTFVNVCYEKDEFEVF